MNKTKIITTALLLTALGAGCTKDSVNDNHMKIFSDTFNSGAKVAVDPNANPVTSGWVVDEPIWIEGDIYNVANNGEGFYIEVDNAQDIETAIYPGQPFGGNLFELFDDEEIVLQNLVIDLTDNTPQYQHMAFPMIGTKSGSSLFFHHLTAGLKLSLANASMTDQPITSLKIVAWSTDDAYTSNLGEGLWTVRWANQGPTVPFGPTGYNDQNLNVRSSSEMNFTFKTNGNDGTVIYAENNIKFCVPITINHVQYLTITGYNGDEEIFSKTADFGASEEIERNHMYNLGQISIN